MILPDLNLLLYAHNRRAPQHEKSLAWWNGCLQQREGIALAWVVIMGFVRITSHPKVFEFPLPIEDALERVDEWLGLPHVRLVHPAATHFTTWSSLLKQGGAGGNLTTDAHLAALAMERGLVLYTTDQDFSRFPGLRWINPLFR